MSGLFQEKVHSIYHSLSTLSWSSAARGGLLSALPGKTTFPKSTLSKYLSCDWLTDEHVDQMIFLDLGSIQLEETLADKPLLKKGKVVAMSSMDWAESEQEDEDGSFELASWASSMTVPYVRAWRIFEIFFAQKYAT